MIERLIEASVRNRFVVLILAAALAVFGVYALLDTPVDAVPDLGENQVIVFTDWPGRSPRDCGSPGPHGRRRAGGRRRAPRAERRRR